MKEKHVRRRKWYGDGSYGSRALPAVTDRLTETEVQVALDFFFFFWGGGVGIKGTISERAGIPKFVRDGSRLLSPSNRGKASGEGAEPLMGVNTHHAPLEVGAATGPDS